MSLHNLIMNIPCQEPEVRSYGAEPAYAYKLGHRDARHRAAELATAADARIEELEHQRAEMLEIFQWMNDNPMCHPNNMRAAAKTILEKYS